MVFIETVYVLIYKVARQFACHVRDILTYLYYTVGLETINGTYGVVLSYPWVEYYVGVTFLPLVVVSGDVEVCGPSELAFDVHRLNVELESVQLCGADVLSHFSHFAIYRKCAV